MKKLTLTLEPVKPFPNKTWMVEETGEREEKIRELFGTNKLPTAFCYPMSGEEVKSRMQGLNPDSVVTVKYRRMKSWKLIRSMFTRMED